MKQSPSPHPLRDQSSHPEDGAHPLHKIEGKDGASLCVAEAGGPELVVEEMRSELSDEAAAMEVSERALRNLRQQVARLTAASDVCFDAFVVLDQDNQVVLSNRRFTDFFGVASNAVRSAGLDKLHECLKPCFEKPAEFEARWLPIMENACPVRHVEWSIVKPTRRVLELHILPLPAAGSRQGTARVLLWEDVTEKKSMQAVLQNSQRMEAIGMLAGGIAHDFNNLLTAISGNITLAMEQLAAGETRDVPSLLTIASEATSSGKDLIRKLLCHVRQNEPSVQAIDLRASVNDVRVLLKHSISPLILVELRLPGNLWPVKADANGIKQVIMNFCVNAVDAMKDRPNSHLTISAANLPAPVPSQHASARPDADYVLLQVRDNGPGIPQEIRQKIFEPFFTTKAQGEGTGLGLAISRDIVESHGGWIECESETGVGTVFSVYLPRSLTQVDVPAAPKAPVLPAGKANGTERILVVDDDALVRGVSTRLLTRAGYKVSTANDGVDALEWLKNPVNHADLVLLDLAMPRLSGVDTMEEIRKMKPGLPVVLCSGSLTMSDPQASRYVTGKHAPEARICKPYDVGELTGTVRKVLDRMGKKQEPSA